MGMKTTIVFQVSVKKIVKLFKHYIIYYDTYKYNISRL